MKNSSEIYKISLKKVETKKRIVRFELTQFTWKAKNLPLINIHIYLKESQKRVTLKYLRI